MATITLVKSGRKIEALAGSSLMKSLLAAGVPVASSCHGDGVCAKCRVQILEGAENLSLRNETEVFLAEKASLKKNERISCQVEVLSDVVVDASYW